MKLILKLILILLLPSTSNAFRVVGWWVGEPNNPSFPIEKLRWDIYTHIRFGHPSNHNNGTVYCNKTDHQFHKVIKLAHKHNTKVQWGGGIEDIHDVLWNPEKTKFRENYLNSIGKAVHECEVDGIDIDYEYGDSKYMKWGIVSYKESNRYTQFLADIKKSMGSDKIISADISIWGIGNGQWILGFLPWINATMLNNGQIDFINTMSYHWSSSGNIWAWKKDRFFIDLWGIDRKKVNIGIPYYSTKCQKNVCHEPTWREISPLCPDILPSLNICNNTVIVGKDMNEKLGRWAKEKGFGGVFPWAADYDSVDFNNSLISWLSKGFGA
jgi:hypothetical protein